jgi:hypothetical protein
MGFAAASRTASELDHNRAAATRQLSGSANVGNADAMHNPKFNLALSKDTDQ